MSFSATLQKHLTAVANRDLPTFTSTLATDGNLTLIMPNGTVMQGADAIIDFHRDWFSDPDWSLELEPINQWERENVGTAIYNVTYSDLDPDGNPYHLRYVLTLVFMKQSDEWLLVHDQNTMLPNDG